LLFVGAGRGDDPKCSVGSAFSQIKPLKRIARVDRLASGSNKYAIFLDQFHGNRDQDRVFFESPSLRASAGGNLVVRREIKTK
jgi:hypothetical protein